MCCCTHGASRSDKADLGKEGVNSYEKTLGHPAENRFSGTSGFPENFLDNSYEILAIKIPL
jgi:hypothetical protein